MEIAVNLYIKGLVQGVGFRPFIYRLAVENGIKGWVKNTNEGIEIYAQAGRNNINTFIDRIKLYKPVASVIEEISSFPSPLSEVSLFSINQSENRSLEVTSISPDIAVCKDCLDDMDRQGNRISYPFVNCTNCGPRFSIISDLPYDRINTSMSVFPMCRSCREEYDDIHDRRFHAQPVACLHCGPSYELYIGEQRYNGSFDTILSIITGLISDGKIVAMKGVGGYHLACNAFDEQAIRTLREQKKRDGKPFAIMFRDLESLTRYAVVDRYEQNVLQSWRRPIVILQKKKKKNDPELCPMINSGLNSIGAFLPYMPIHYLLFRLLPFPAIVLTSGNISSEPIVKDDPVALQMLPPVSDAILTYNREIVHREDDSVVCVINSRERLIRRSRGYVPAAIRLSMNVEGVLAFGAELSSCFAIGKGESAILSQYIGDLKTLETYSFYEKTISDFFHLFRIKPELLACDMHPEYFSTKKAASFHGIPVVSVQHHHAHIASCMAEHGLDEKVIGVALDGTGLGIDGKIWGGEFLVCDLADFKRVLHFGYIVLPGGDHAVDEPWRIAIAYLYKIFGRDFLRLPLPFLKTVDSKKILTIVNMIDQNVNCPEASSVGRLFDAVAAILNLCLESTFQAEGPMRLESLVKRNCHESYPFTISNTILLEETINAIVQDVIRGVNNSIISTKFHNTIISIIFESVRAISNKEKTKNIVLSGGVFQNKYLLENTERLLRKAGMKVYSHEKIPSNDGGIALGQIIVAAKKRKLKCV